MALSLHPDRNIGAPVADIAAKAAKLTLVNEAWQCLGSESSRLAHDRQINVGRPSPHSGRTSSSGESGGIRSGAVRSPGRTTDSRLSEKRSYHRWAKSGCRYCGYSPAALVDLRATSGGVISGLLSSGSRVETGPVCKVCGIAIYRQLMRSMVVGRFPPGPLATLVILGNLQFWPRLARLGDPVAPSGPSSVVSKPLAPEHPVMPQFLARTAVWLTVAALVVACVYFIGELVGGGSFW
jgi:hypothetical protein